MSGLPDVFTNREKKLITFLREIRWGEVRIRVENGQPVLVYEAVRTFRLEENQADKGRRSKREQVQSK